MNNWQGKEGGPVLIAEIGGNHEGNFDYAMELTQLAIASGADYVKFQIYTGDTLVSQLEGPDRNKHFKKFELTQEQHIQLAKTCATSGVGYMSSVWDWEAIDWIDPYIKVYKIGSGDLTAYPFLKKIATKNKPIILSTGLADQQEVIDTVTYLQSVNPIFRQKDNLAILQCTSMYPIPDQDAHLNVMLKFKEMTGLAVGYSDHTEGMTALITATAMGADVLEFHFTDSREGKTFRDHKVSLTKDEVISLKKEILKIKSLQGDHIKTPLDVEGDHVVSFRRAVYPIEDIPSGTIISENHLTCLRPNHGIDAREFDKLIGKKTRQSLKKHQKLDWELFE